MKPIAPGDLLILPGLLDPPGPGWTRLHAHCCWWKIADHPGVVGDEFSVVSPATAAAGALVPPLLPILDVGPAEPEAEPEPAAGCEPYVCKFPRATDHRAGDRWTCPGCGTVYRLTRPKYQWFWRNWSAPHGHWVVTEPLAWALARARAQQAQR